MSTIPILYEAQPIEDPFFVGAITHVRWANAEETLIQCTVTFPKHPQGLTEPMPFTADAHDSEAHGRLIFYRCTSGEFGPIGEYEPPADELLDAQAQSRVANLLLQTQLQVDQHRDELEAGGPTTLDASEFSALQAYRAALRALKHQPDYPRSITWPDQPLATARSQTH